MTEKEIFNLWAPLDSPWSVWAKPVLFTQLEHSLSPASAPAEPEAKWRNFPDLAGQRLAIVIDLPGAEAVALALRLAQAGFQPVPLFNTSYGQNAVLSVTRTITALALGAQRLRTIARSPNALPVFILDADRMRDQGPALPGKFDNRWLVFPQDFPSAQFLKDHHVQGILLVQVTARTPQDDMAHVLLRWQESNLPVFSLSLANPKDCQPLRVHKPSHYKTLWYHFLTVLKLRRNSAGGFGSRVPEPNRSGGGFS